jgi:hypothetical protein
LVITRRPLLLLRPLATPHSDAILPGPSNPLLGPWRVVTLVAVAPYLLLLLLRPLAALVVAVEFLLEAVDPLLEGARPAAGPDPSLRFIPARLMRSLFEALMGARFDTLRAKPPVTLSACVSVARFTSTTSAHPSSSAIVLSPSLVTICQSGPSWLGWGTHVVGLRVVGTHVLLAPMRCLWECHDRILYITGKLAATGCSYA